MSLDVYRFRAALKDGGAKANYFRVIMNFPSYVRGPTEQASFLIKASSFPAATLGKIEVPFRGRQVPYPGDREFEDWSVTVINGNDFAVRDALLAWQNGINDFRFNTGIQNPDQVLADMKIQQLDKNERPIKTVEIRGAFPLQIGEIEVSYESNNTIEEFQATFAYIHWEPGASANNGNLIDRLRNLVGL